MRRVRGFWQGFLAGLGSLAMFFGPPRRPTRRFTRTDVHHGLRWPWPRDED